MEGPQTVVGHLRRSVQQASGANFAGPRRAKNPLGPEVLAVAVRWSKDSGLSMRKTCGLLKMLLGLRLSTWQTEPTSGAA